MQATHVSPLWLSVCLTGSLMAQGIIDEGPEPNDLTGTPTFMTCGSRIDGNLTAGDFDYYQIPIGAPTLLKAYTSIGRGSTVRTDTWLEIRDSADVLLTEDDDSGQGTSSYVGCNITVPGVYYIVVRGFATTTAGPYAMDVICMPLGVAEGPEPNNGPLLGGTPTPGTCGSEHHGFIAAGDDDWIAVIHPGGNLTVTTGPGGPDAPPSGVSLEDTIVEVYSSASALLGVDDDGGEALYSSLTMPALATGLYYVKVYAFGAADSGFYSVRVGCGEPASVEGQIGPGLGTAPGCSGAAGIPTLTARSTNTSSTGTRVRPRLGTTFSVDATNLPPASLVFHIVGLSLPAPFDLTPLGAPGCVVGVSTELIRVDFADAAGQSRSWLFVPFFPAFIGTPLHWQSASFFPAHNALGVATSNVITGAVGNIAFQ